MGKDSIPQPSQCPQKTLQILHMALPSPVGSRPGRVFGKSSRDRGPGQPTCLPPHPHHDWEHRSSQRIGKGLGPLASRCSLRNASARMGGAHATTGVPSLDTSEQSLQMG